MEILGKLLFTLISSMANPYFFKPSFFFFMKQQSLLAAHKYTNLLLLICFSQNRITVGVCKFRLFFKYFIKIKRLLMPNLFFNWYVLFKQRHASPQELLLSVSVNIHMRVYYEVDHCSQTSLWAYLDKPVLSMYSIWRRCCLLLHVLKKAPEEGRLGLTLLFFNLF